MKSPERRTYIDWARGLAVLLMIEAHAVDAWTRSASRDSAGFRAATILGGCAAPLFLWLAGVSVALAASRATRRDGSRRSGSLVVCRRGLEIFLLAFLFRLQAFALSPGSSPLMLFRVDILNIMGPAVAVAALVWAAAASTGGRLAAYAALAITIALAAPAVQDARWVGAVPTWIQWYLRPAGEYTTFTVFPWTGFVFAGSAAGVLIDRAGVTVRERAAVAWIAATGAALVAVGLYAAGRPPLHPASSFWTTSSSYFTIRTGLVMTTLAMLFAVERRWPAAAWGRPLSTFGRHSLFVYWVHVELVYGYASYFWWTRLPLWATAIAYAAFVVLMYRAVLVKRTIERWWDARRRAAPVAAAA